MSLTNNYEEYNLDPEHWSKYIDKDYDLLKIIPENFSPFILYYYKDSDEIVNPEESYLLGVCNSENVVRIFDVRVSPDGYQVCQSDSFLYLNFTEECIEDKLGGAFSLKDDYLECKKFSKRLADALAFFEKCNEDDYLFQKIELLYLADAEKNKYTKRIHKSRYDGFKHDNDEIYWSLKEVNDNNQLVKVFSLNYFFILVIIYNENEKCYNFDVYQHVIIESNFENIKKYYYYNETLSSCKNYEDIDKTLYREITGEASKYGIFWHNNVIKNKIIDNTQLHREEWFFN